MDYYDTIAHGYDELYREEQDAKFRLIQEHLRIGKQDMILDVGCGTGLSTQMFPSRIIGIDSSKEMLYKARTRCRGDVEYVLGCAEHLPFKGTAFKRVICVTALHNFTAPEEALHEIKRVCARNGVVTVMKKAANADDLEAQVALILGIEAVVEGDKDRLLFFGSISK